MKKIENIFSNSEIDNPIKTCPNPNTPIIVDKREKQSLILANLVEQKANIYQEILEIGDYLIGDTIIERKTYQDFLASLKDKRLFNQINQMKKYKNQILIIESFDFSYKSNFHSNAIRGAILSILNIIPIIYTENEKDTSTFLIQIAKRQTKLHKKDASLRETKTTLNIQQQKQFILEGFPEIGPTTAKKLIKEFQTLSKIFNATEKKLTKILSKNQLLKFTKILN